MINGLNHITLAVKDIEISFNFYNNVMGFKPLCKWDKRAYILIGENTPNELWFCLNSDDKRQETKCYTHYAFTVAEEDFDIVRRKIIEHAKIFKDNTSPGESIYFLDPDGHKLEIHIGNWKERLKYKKQNLGS